MGHIRKDIFIMDGLEIVLFGTQSADKIHHKIRK